MHLLLLLADGAAAAHRRTLRHAAEAVEPSPRSLDAAHPHEARAARTVELGAHVGGGHVGEAERRGGRRRLGFARSRASSVEAAEDALLVGLVHIDGELARLAPAAPTAAAAPAEVGRAERCPRRAGAAAATRIANLAAAGRAAEEQPPALGSRGGAAAAAPPPPAAAAA